MHSFQYNNGNLHAEGVDLTVLAEQYGTPLYVYSAYTLRDHYRRLSKALAGIPHRIQYAVKANSNLAVLNLLKLEGAGFDIVSGGELHRVLQIAADPDTVSFAGVGKTTQEIEEAIEAGIHVFICESWAELVEINRIAAAKNKQVPVAIRVNPNVDAKTHKYISTGKSENKFGVDFELIEEMYAAVAKQLPHLVLRGLQMHIGSQLTTVEPFVEALVKVVPLAKQLKNQYQIEFFSIGGGVGIVYDQSLQSGEESWWQQQPESERPITIEDYAAAILPELRDLGLQIHLEPGRLIAGNAGVLLTQVLYTKQGQEKTFQICDAGMGDLIRPALYQGFHQVVPVVENSAQEKQRTDLVGPICESGDFFVQDAEMVSLNQGDLVALMSAGAYGYTMASNYNSRPLPAEILVDGKNSFLIRKRQSYADLTDLENWECTQKKN